MAESSITHHFYERLCKGHDHTYDPPPLDGWFCYSINNGDTNTVQYFTGTPEPTEVGLVIHFPDRHLVFPWHRIDFFEDHACSDNWHDSMKLWYEAEHGITFIEFLQMQNREQEIMVHNEMQKAMKEFFEGGDDD